jgi:hypothetical protein
MNCERCGIEIDERTIVRRKARGQDDQRCSDCRTQHLYEIKYEGIVCRPWRGEVDEDLNPIDGQLRLYLPGIRTCGHRDCVNKEHIIQTPQKVERNLDLERYDTSYRTGRLAELEDYMRELSA